MTAEGSRLVHDWLDVWEDAVMMMWVGSLVDGVGGEEDRRTTVLYKFLRARARNGLPIHACSLLPRGVGVAGRQVGRAVCLLSPIMKAIAMYGQVGKCDDDCHACDAMDRHRDSLVACGM